MYDFVTFAARSPGGVWPNPDTPINFTGVKIEPTVMSTDVDIDNVSMKWAFINLYCMTQS